MHFYHYLWGGGIKVQHFETTFKATDKGTIYFPQNVKDTSKMFLIVDTFYPFYITNISNNSFYIYMDSKINISEFTTIHISVQVIEFV